MNKKAFTKATSFGWLDLVVMMMNKKAFTKATSFGWLDLVVMMMMITNKWPRTCN